MSLLKIYSRMKHLVYSLENDISSFFYGLSNKPQLSLLPLIESKRLPPTNSSSLIDTLKDAFLFAVPKSRRTIQKRRNRRFGFPQYHWKMLVPKTNLINCNTCGHPQEAGVLCPNCYKRIREETEAMQKAIEAELKLEPIDKEVVVLYDNEIQEKGSEFWQGKRIVEMKKERPSWFSENLLQKTTEENTDSSTTKVKPSDLA
ncbi:mitochondrial ribosomal protein L32 [Rhodnius prolixus]